MKVLLAMIFIFIAFSTLQAQNTFPSTGNAGIGTITPAHKLDITSPDNDGGTGATRVRLANTTSSGTAAAGSLPAIEVLGARGDGNGSFEGRLALGTRRSDGTPLSNQILGAVLFGGQHGTDQNFQAGKIAYPASIKGVAEGAFTNVNAMPTAIVFSTGTAGQDVGVTNTSYGTERMRITNTGNVGIGTSSPGTYKLAVEGTIGARKVKVTMASWADYVFEPGYDLPSLQDVEKFIQQHKHLPGVPSTEEITKEGLDIGSNQEILLKKIEELTLYLLEQNKMLQQLNAENGILKREIAEIKHSISEANKDRE